MRGRTKKVLIASFLGIGLGLCITGIFVPTTVGVALITVGGTTLGGALVVTKMLFTKGHETPPNSTEEVKRQATVTFPTEKEKTDVKLEIKPEIVNLRRSSQLTTVCKDKEDTKKSNLNLK